MFSELVKAEKHCLVEGSLMPEAHWHQDYELVLVVEGGLILEIDSQLVEVNQGEMVMINPNQFHQVKSNLADATTYYSIKWQPTFLESHQLDEIEQEFFAPLTSGRRMFVNQPFLAEQVTEQSGLGFQLTNLVQLIASHRAGGLT